MINNISIKPYFILTLLCLLLYLPGITKIPIIDRDSPHFAQATKQMLETNNFSQVNFQDQPRHLKPPGIYWLQALAVKIFSPSNFNAVWPYRIPSILGALLAVLGTYYFANRHFDSKTAFLAAAILATTVLLQLETRLSITDTALLFTMVFMQGALWQIYNNNQTSQKVHPIWPSIFWLAMAAGIVIKGMTPVIALLTILTLAVCDRSFRGFKHMYPLLGITAVILLTAAWLLPVSYSSHSNFLFDMISRDLLPKITSGQQSHGKPPGYFMLLFPLMFWPASIFFWQGAVAGLTRNKQPVWRFLLAWAIPTWIFFELIPTKLPEYVLPAYPAVAILIAASLLAIVPVIQDEHKEPNITAAKKSFRKLWQGYLIFYYAIWFLYSLALAGFIAMVPHIIDHRWQPFAIIAASIIVITSIMALFFIWQQQMEKALKTLIIAALLSFPLFFHFVLPALKNCWLSEKVKQAITTTCPNCVNNDTPLLAIGYGEPSLVFILGTHQVKYTDLIAIGTEVKNNTQQLLLVDKRYQQAAVWEVEQAQMQLQQIAIVNGFNFSNGKWTTLYLDKVIKK